MPLPMTITLSVRTRALLLALFALMPPAIAARAAASDCAPAGQWVRLDERGPHAIPSDRYLAELSRKQVVLLGENHESAEHHRWQLHTVSALYALHPDLVLGFEMFPRRVQPVLDEWTAGKLSERELLARSEWGKVWGFDPQLYLPVFHFARMHRIPMVALNIDRALVRRIGEQGWSGVPAEAREGIGDPAPPSEAYLAALHESWLEHLPQTHPARKASTSAPDLRDPEFLHFVDGMLAWDRAMAEGIAARLQDRPRLVVALLGSGHIRDAYGVPHQLRALGVRDVAVLLPWDAQEACDALKPGVADAVFGTDVPAVAEAAQRPRLGVVLETGANGVAVREVMRGSIAERAGMLAGDVLTEVAGRTVGEASDVVGAVQRQAPGTWLPLTVRRGERLVELVARFPPAP
jgi:uncharacterized iron-regulated protein